MHHSYSVQGTLNPDYYKKGWHVLVAKEILKRTREYELECWRPERNIKNKFVKVENNITYKVFPSRYIYFGREYSLELINSLRMESNKNDIIIHIHEMHSHLSYLLAYFFKNIPIVAQHHGALPPPVLMKKSDHPLRYISIFEYLIEKKVFHNIDHFFALTDLERDYLAELVGPNKVEILTMGVDFNIFKPMDKYYSREQLGLDVEKRYIVFVGGSQRRKGVEYLIASMKEVLNRCPDTVLIVTGGKMDEWVKKLIEKYKISNNNIKWLGYVKYEKLPVIYNSADVFVIPSILEGQEGAPVALIEALACGIPAVGSKIGGIPNIIKNFSSELPAGIIIPPRNSKALSEAIIKILNNPYNFRVDVRKGKKIYDWDVIVKRYLQVYKKLYTQ